MNTRVVFGLSIAAVTLAAGCGGGSSRNIADTSSANSGSGSSDRVVTSTTCATKDLTLSIGAGNGAAGSIYEPLRFTNNAASACTLDGYPGVSFVTEGSGDQVGAPASRNPQHPAKTVTLAPGASAEAVLQVVDHGNYGPDQCKATGVSGLRVYPPGNKDAAYVAFDTAATACSTNVAQLTVEAVTPTGS